jgi:YggT family protein
MTFIDTLIAGFLSPLLLGLFWIFVAYMIFSWLIAFNIINMRNHSAVRVYNLLRSICDPILDPIRKIVPPFGGLDMAFLVVVLGLNWVLKYGLDYLIRITP